MHITGTAYRGAWGVANGADPTTFVVAANANVQVGTEVVGTAALAQDTDGTVTADSQIDDAYSRWTRTRHYYDVVWDGAQPNTLVCVELVVANDDPDLPQWTQVA